jgi:assimilatory nitrate reductase catalytic subunit
MGGREVGGLANQLAAHMGFSPVETSRVGRFWEAPRIATREGLKAVDMFQAIERGTIKALWVMATNPAVSLPRAGAMRAALKKLELFVVSENVLDNDTVTAGAQVLFPAAAWGEKDGTVTNSERRISRQRAFLPSPGEARPDWWIVTEVARRLGFGEAFNYRSVADVFREHAALSAFENGGQRDFDIGGLAHLSDASYDRLDPVMWPARAGEAREEQRFFNGGGFFTTDGKARFVAPQPHGSHDAVNAVYPLRLNTGRMRDQWHTMTRTGLSPRLCAHSPEPIVEIHPADAKIAKLDDGGFAKVTTDSGCTILKVSISEGQQRGMIFTPIHWSDATAAHARIGDMVTAATDPFSGQPDLKATPARVEPMTFAYRGFALSHSEIMPPSETWFARAAVVGGDGLLFASNDPPEAWRDFARRQMPDNCEITEHFDPERGIVRVAAFRSGQLEACIFLGPAQAPQRWDAMRALFEAGELDENERLILLSERGDESRIDNGPVICACFGVRLTAIRDALETGIAADVADIGRILRAGTNCGSCVPELRGIIDKAAQAA